MSQIINSKIEDAIQSLVKTAELTAQYGDDSLKDADIFGKMVEGLINVENNMKKAEQAAKVAKDMQSIDEYDAAYAGEFNKQPNYKPKLTDEYKRFMTETRTILSMDINTVAESTNVVVDDDLFMEIEVSDLDPLTKRRMTNPMKNTVCGHYYEKATILECIQVNPRLRCPVAGCGNNQFLKKAHLIDDPVFRMKLQRTNQEN